MLPEALPSPAIEFKSARDYGDVWALTELWNSLGFGRLRQIFRRTRHSIDIEALIRVMVFNRLCDPDSRLGLLRWLETIALPGVMAEAIEHQHLLRAMDALVAHQGEVDQILSGLLRPLVDQSLAVVFYDMTMIRAEGLSQQDADVRKFGMSKEGSVAHQVMHGVVQTADGLPLYHEVFDGNTAEATTLKSTIEKIVRRFPVRCVIAVADCGLLSTDNLAELQAFELPGGGTLEFILAVPGRRYGDFVELIAPFHEGQCAGAKRDTRIQELEVQAMAWTGKLDGQDTGQKTRGRKLSDGGARARFYHEVCEAHLAHIVRVELKSELFTYAIDERALAHARLMDGKLLLVTNAADLAPDEVVKRYKSLADIERGFRVLKSEIEIEPIYHRLPNRIRAHAQICFMALILYRLMRTRLRASETRLSPERALSTLRRIQHHRVILDGNQPVAGISSINQVQADILSALTINKPTLNIQLTLL